MKLFVYEFVTGGGLAQEPLPPSLVRDGDQMLRALVADLAELPGVRVLTTRDPRLPPLVDIETVNPAPGEEPSAAYQRGVAAADAAWPIAPETGGALERLARLTLAQGKVLLGCGPEAVRVAASKRATIAALSQAGVAAVPTFARAGEVPRLPGPWVVKPDDGAGCDGALLVEGWRAARQHLDAEPGRLVAQPWIEGDALSLSLVCGPGGLRLLSCNRQHVRLADRRLVLDGVDVNTVFDRGERFARLAAAIAAAIPGLWGYVGVDLVRSRDGPVVLEVNPRLTTSYCGLRQALGINPAAMVLDLLRPVAGSAPPRAPERCRAE